MEQFYSIGGVGNAPIYVFATLELVVILAFLFGFAKRRSYGLVLLLHAVSRLSSYKKFLEYNQYSLDRALWVRKGV